MFRICPDCDFEWHSKDGMKCPVCDESKPKSAPYQEFGGRAFGTGPNQERLKNWYIAIAIISLVLIIQALILS